MAQERETPAPDTQVRGEINKSEEQWRQNLSPEQYRVAAPGGPPKMPLLPAKFVHKQGERRLLPVPACGAELFSSGTKVRLRHRLAEASTSPRWPRPVELRSDKQPVHATAPRSSAVAAAVTWARPSTTGPAAHPADR